MLDNFDDMMDDSELLESELDGVTPEPVDEEELEELLADDILEADPEDWENDVEADADTLRSAGWGTDEDYGYYGDDDF